MVTRMVNTSMKMASRTTTTKAVGMAGMKTDTGKGTGRTAVIMGTDNTTRTGSSNCSISRGITMATTLNDSRMTTICGESRSRSITKCGTRAA